MGRAAGRNAARGQPDSGGLLADELEELRHHWGSAYEIGLDGTMCTARRRDGKGAILSDPVPEGLRLRIVADYQADPVPRAETLKGMP